jgi:hypothetical protein
MAVKDYNFYELLTNNDGTIDIMPFINIPVSPTDKYEEYILGVTRFDKLSQKYYGSPIYSRFIEIANPQFLNEWEFTDGEIIRIPFPLDSVKSYFESGVKKIKNQ